jgi:hypothetical protein
MRTGLFVLTALCILMIFTTCGDPLVAKGIKIDYNTGGGETMTVPGSNGLLTSDDLTFYDGLKIHSMDQEVDPELVTTQATFGTWDNDKYYVQGNLSSTSALDSAGFNDAVLIYYDTPFTGDFRISARIKMTANGGLSSAKGVYFGAFVPGNTDLPLYKNSRSAGLYFRTSNGSGAQPAVRYYYSNETASDQAIAFHAGQNNSTELMTNADWKREYIYEFTRRGGEYTIRLLNSKTYDSETIPTRILPDTERQLALDLRQGMPVYAGICLLAVSAEVSEIRIWNTATPNWDYKVRYTDEEIAEKDDLIFHTPYSEPAYVPAQNIVMLATNVTPSGSALSLTATTANGKPVRQYSYPVSAVSGGRMQLRPTLEPTWADENIGFEWFTVEGHESMTLKGTGAAGANPEVPVSGRIYKEGLIEIDTTKLPTSGQAAVYGRFLIVARNPALDTEEEKAALDWSLRQTLPEYYFQVRIAP